MSLLADTASCVEFNCRFVY